MMPPAISILPCISLSTMSEIDASEPSPKRVKVELPSLGNLDLQQLVLADNGIARNGSKLLMPLMGKTKVLFNLIPKGFLKAPFGFDVSSKYEKPSFLSGAEPRRSEGLSLVLQLGDNETKHLQSIDSIFQHKYAEFDKKSQWHDMLGGNDKYGASLKVKVVLKGEGLTQLKIVSGNTVCTGYGWEFLQPFMAENRNFRSCRCKATVALSQLWCVSRKAGLCLTATHLVLAPPDPSSAFENDTFDDELLMAELGERAD